MKKKERILEQCRKEAMEIPPQPEDEYFNKDASYQRFQERLKDMEETEKMEKANEIPSYPVSYGVQFCTLILVGCLFFSSSFLPTYGVTPLRELGNLEAPKETVYFSLEEIPELPDYFLKLPHQVTPINCSQTSIAMSLCFSYLIDQETLFCLAELKYQEVSYHEIEEIVYSSEKEQEKAVIEQGGIRYTFLYSGSKEQLESILSPLLIIEKENKK